MRATLILVLCLLASACAPQAAQTPPYTPPAQVETLPAVVETSPVFTQEVETAQPAVTEPVSPENVEEAILILEPGPGSRVVGKINLNGEADPTFEQHLLVKVILDDGTEIASVPTIIGVEAGKRGPFSVEIPFSVDTERQAFIQVSSSSARDGGTTHLASVGVTISPTGPEQVYQVEPHPEQLVILQPAPGDQISGGMLHVQGYGWASFEQTLVVDILDIDGKVIGSQPVIVNSPEMGEPGTFEVDMAYTLRTAGPGRVVVRDPSVVIPSDVHLSSIEVNLSP